MSRSSTPGVGLIASRMQVGPHAEDVCATFAPGRPPIVLLHGIGMSGEYYLPFASELAATYDVRATARTHRRDLTMIVPPKEPAGRRRQPVPMTIATVVLTALTAVLPGCTTAPDDPASPDGGGTAGTGQWTTETIAGMSVSFYVPTTAPAQPAGRALMVNLHGCVQKAADLRNGGNWTSTADEYGMVVAVPAAPDGGVFLGCWDYYGTDHSRTAPSGHDDNLLGLVKELDAREGLGIDEDQVYLSGLSSGAGQAMVIGCLAPEVFAGIGIVAGPTVGTTSRELSWVASTQAQGTATCLDFAGTAGPSFDTQLTSIVYGSNDTAVASGYNTINGQIMAGIYGATDTTTFTLDELAGTSTAGSGTLYSDAAGPRVSVIQNTGLGHNWPAGGGPGGTYISTSSIDYPAYVTEFFFENNRRIDLVLGPTTQPDPAAVPEQSHNANAGVILGNRLH